MREQIEVPHSKQSDIFHYIDVEIGHTRELMNLPSDRTMEYDSYYFNDEEPIYLIHPELNTRREIVNPTESLLDTIHNHVY